MKKHVLLKSLSLFFSEKSYDLLTYVYKSSRFIAKTPITTRLLQHCNIIFPLQGFAFAYNVLGQFLLLDKNEEIFKIWMKDVVAANAKQGLWYIFPRLAGARLGLLLFKHNRKMLTLWVTNHNIVFYIILLR